MAYNASRASAQRHPSEENSSKGANSNANREPGFSTVDQGPVTRHTLKSGNQESSSSNSQPYGQAQALQSAEACKRRCLGRDIDQKSLDSTKFGRDSVKALFNIGTSRIEPGQAHTSPSGGSHAFVPFKALPLGPDTPHSFAQLGFGKGSVPTPSPFNTSPVTTGRSFAEAAFAGSDLTAGVPIGNAVDLKPGSHYVIPGLGAPVESFRPANADEDTGKSATDRSAQGIATSTNADNKGFSGTSVSSESQSHGHGGFCGPGPYLQQPPMSPDHVISKTAEKEHDTPKHVKFAEGELKSPLQDKTVDQDSNSPMKQDDPSSPQTPVGRQAEQVEDVSSAKALASPKEPVFIRPPGPPPVWREKQSPGNFKLQRVIRKKYLETFDGALELIGTLNPDHFRMSYGTRVIAIKCPNLDSMLVSMQTGLWSTNKNVMARIMEVHDSHTDSSEKTLLLYSIPGSKFFCGLVELQGFRPDDETNFSDKDDEAQEGALIIRWLYCKLVSFDEARRVETYNVKESVTQMWNGMHYSEGTGRELVRTYVESPHMENLLIKPRTEFFRKAIANSRIANPRRALPEPSYPRGPRFQENQRTITNGFHRKGRAEDGKREGSWRHQDASQQQSTKPGIPGVQHVDDQVDTPATSASLEHSEQVAEPKLQYLPILVHADGTITAAAGKLIALDANQREMESSESYDSAAFPRNISIASLKGTSSLFVAPPTNTPNTMSTFSEYEKSSSIRSNGQVMNDKKTQAAETPNTSSPSHRSKISSIFGNVQARSTYDMAPPSNPNFARNANANVRGTGGLIRSSPSANRVGQNFGSLSKMGGHHGGVMLPQTPLKGTRSAYNLSGSPMNASSYGSPTPRANRVTYGSGGKSRQGMHGHGQAFGQLNTANSSPMSANNRTPVKQQLAPPPFVLGAEESETFSCQQLKHDQWIDKLVDPQDNE